MVSITEHSKYLDQINQQPKLLAFWLLISDARSISDISVTDVDRPEDKVYLGMIRALAFDNRSEFEKFYLERSKGKPVSASTAPFIHVDFLIFSIILGLTRYNLNLDWVQHILGLRSKNELTRTFENILAKNYFSHDNVPEVVFIFLSKNHPEMIDQSFTTRVFQTMCQRTDVDTMKNDFQKMCILRSYDLIIQLKTVPVGSEIFNLRKFEVRFLRRTRIFSWCLQIALLALVILGIIKVSTQWGSWINEHSAIFTTLGFIGLSVLNYVPVTREFLYQATTSLFGYPKECWSKKQLKRRNKLS